jgi:hypothetical protein
LLFRPNSTWRRLHAWLGHSSRTKVNVSTTSVISFIKKTNSEPGSSVSIVSVYGLDDRPIELRSSAEAEFFSLTSVVQTGSDAHPASCTMGTGDPFPGGKGRPGRDADHPPPTSAEIENE